MCKWVQNSQSSHGFNIDQKIVVSKHSFFLGNGDQNIPEKTFVREKIIFGGLQDLFLTKGLLLYPLRLH